MQTLPPIQQNAIAHLVQNCENSTYANITRITFPNSSIALVGQFAMTRNDDNYNYTFSNTSNLGQYLVYGSCDENGRYTAWVYDFFVTPTGIIQTTSQGLGSLGFLILMLSLTVMIAWGGFRLAETKNIWILGVFMLFLAGLLMVYDVWLGYEYHRNYTGLSDSGMPETIFYMFMFIVVVGLLVSAILLFTRWKDLLKYLKREWKDKKQDEFDFDDMDEGDWRKLK